MAFAQEKFALLLDDICGSKMHGKAKGLLEKGRSCYNEKSTAAAALLRCGKENYMAQMIFARPDGQWFDLPALQMAGMQGEKVVCPVKPDLIPLPEGATLTLMPGFAPVGFDSESGEFLQLEENPYKNHSEPVFAVAALLPQGFTRLMLPAAVKQGEEILPQLGYTAVGVEKGKLVVAAMQTDEHRKWNPVRYNSNTLPKLIEKRLREFPENRIIRQLANCSEQYGCFTAQNIFYRRWEGGIPVSPSCNAECVACLSYQQEESCQSSQQRICFSPEAREIAEIAIPHLQKAEEPIISFGQGCEGEPSLAWPMICEALRIIRSQTERGMVNINTNAGNTKAIAALIEHGINSLRVSMFSAIAEDYHAYHQPKDFCFDDVRASLRLAQEKEVPVALNLLAWPGFTDDEQQVEALLQLIREFGVQQVQLRNLNCDPAVMQRFCEGRSPLSMRTLLARLRDDLPDVQVGNYTHYCEHSAGSEG